MVLFGKEVGQAGVPDNRTQGLEPRIVQADRPTPVARQSADRAGQHAFLARVDVQDNRHMSVTLPVIICDEAVRRGGKPVQHAALLQVPGLRFSQRLESAIRQLNQPDHRAIVSAGRPLMEVGLQAEKIPPRSIPRTDAIVAEEVVLWTLRYCFRFEGS